MSILLNLRLFWRQFLQLRYLLHMNFFHIFSYRKKNNIFAKYNWMKTFDLTKHLIEKIVRDFILVKYTIENHFSNRSHTIT